MAQIKISGNASEFKKSILELSNFTKSKLGKSSVALFDKDTTKILSGQADKVLANLENRSAKVKGLIGEYAKKVKESSMDSKKELEYKEKLLRATQRLVAVEKDRSSIQSAAKNLKGSNPFAQIGGGLAESAQGIPGLGKVLGLSSMGALGLGIGGAAIGAGIYGYSRMSAGYDKYRAGIGSRMQLMGRGVRDLDLEGANKDAFATVGMDHEAVRKARLQSLDAFGTEGSTQNAVLGRAQFSRNYGIGLDQLQGLGAGMRAQTSSAGANRDIMKLQASLQASEIKDAIGPYLETAASMLTDIRQNGLVDSGQVLSLLSTMTKRTGNSPEQLAGNIAGLQGAVQGSSGESNAFFQTAFAKAGIGGKTLGGVQAAISSGGIFGVGASEMQGMSPEHIKQMQQMGLIQNQGSEKGGVKDRLSAILGMADSQFNTKTGEGMLAQGRFMQNKVGAKNPLEAIKIMDELRDALKSGDLGKMQKLEDKLKKSGASPQEKMLDNLEHMSKSQEGQLDKLEAIRSDQLEFMGKQAAPAAMMMSKSLLHIDEIISDLYSGLSSIIPGMKSEKQKLGSAMSGDSVLSEGQIAEMGQRGGLGLGNGKLIAQEDDLKRELADTQRQRSVDVQNSPGMVSSDDAKIKVLTEHLKNLAASQEKVFGAIKEHIAVSKSIDSSTKKSVKNQTKPKAEVDATGDATMER